jgi:rubrerythrin
MRRWRCIVCGYIHDGETPPYRCPVCGAPREMFEELTAPDRP